MIKKDILILISVLSFLLMICYYSRFHVDACRTDYVYKLQTAATPLPAGALYVISGEFKGMIANYLFLEAAGFIGSMQEASPGDWDAVARLLDQSNSLDPYFRQTYRLSQSTLPWEAKKLEPTLTILERSKKHLPWDWEPGFFIGFDYHHFLKDDQTAFQKLMEASKVPGAPLSLATLASRLASRSGHTAAAIDFLVAFCDKTDDKEKKEILRKRILAIKGVQTLNEAVALFKTKFGRLPNNLNELVKKDILSGLPLNPYSRSYSFNDGQVDF